MDWFANHCSCGGAAKALFKVRDHNFGATAATGEMMRCGDCHALFPARFPVPGALGQAYRGYYTQRPRRGGWRAWPRGAADAARRDYLARHTPQAARRVLDYGCGAGEYLAAIAAGRADREALGTDVTPRPRGPLAYAWLAPGHIEAAAPYDWITLGHVLEHLVEPGAMLDRLARTLAPGGGLWIATPNAESFLFAAAGRWARDVDFPRHREIFSRRGLEWLLTAAGLEPEFKSPPRVNAGLNAVSTLRNIAVDKAAGRLERGRAAWAVIVGLAGHCLQGRTKRDASSPEIVAVCKARSGG